MGIANLSLSGQRIAPREPGKPTAYVPPKDAQKKPQAMPKDRLERTAVTTDNKKHFDVTVYQKKERTGFGGGFKIPEEYRKIKQSRKRGPLDFDDESDHEEKDQSLVTKEEIFKHLNLGNAESGIGGGKYG